MEKETVVKTTRDYEVFKKLKGNRDVTESQVEKVIKSIKTIGLLPNPVIVNENMEVVDGQARVEACKRLGLAVPYMVANGAGIDTAIALNGFKVVPKEAAYHQEEESHK